MKAMLLLLTSLLMLAPTTTTAQTITGEDRDDGEWWVDVNANRDPVTIDWANFNDSNWTISGVSLNPGEVIIVDLQYLSRTFATYNEPPLGWVFVHQWDTFKAGASATTGANVIPESNIRLVRTELGPGSPGGLGHHDEYDVRAKAYALDVFMGTTRPLCTSPTYTWKLDMTLGIQVLPGAVLPSEGG